MIVSREFQSDINNKKDRKKATIQNPQEKYKFCSHYVCVCCCFFLFFFFFYCIAVSFLWDLTLSPAYAYQKQSALRNETYGERYRDAHRWLLIQVLRHSKKMNSIPSCVHPNIQSQPLSSCKPLVRVKANLTFFFKSMLILQIKKKSEKYVKSKTCKLSFRRMRGSLFQPFVRKSGGQRYINL